VASQIFPTYATRSPEHTRLGDQGIPALVVRPEREGSHPGALIQHGYGASKEDLLPLASALAGHGFVVLLPDAWGHGERFPSSGPNWMTALNADYAVEILRRTVDDVHEALTALQGLPDVQPDAILVGGFSLGAMVALIAGTEDPRVAGIFSASGSPLPDLMHAMPFGVAAPNPENERWAREHDAAAHIGRLAPKPLLLQHGRRDDMVAVGGTLRLYEVAKPYYASHADRLALMLYDHTHLVTEAQVRDGINWLLPFFVELRAA
jgi:dienelactone hydrolase